MEPTPTTFTASISSAKEKYCSLWERTLPTLPEDMRQFSPGEQVENEGRIQEMALEAKRGKISGTFSRRNHAPNGPTIRRLMKLSLALLPGDAKPFFESSEVFMELTDQFVQRARRFDPELPDEALVQALRNIWVFSSLRRLAGKELRLTPSAFAYSLLYPYTDNILDSKDTPALGKRRFVERVGARLEGRDTGSVNSTETRIWELLSMIESEFPRPEFPRVYASLLAIHHAQERSVAQGGGMSSEDVLPLTMEKGGTSVLADAFLAEAVTDEHWFDLAFSYGCLLQLIDDLQDAQVDYETGQRTSSTVLRSGRPIQVHTMHLLNFLQVTTDSWEVLITPDQKSLRRFMRDSCSILVMEAIARQAGRFPRTFLSILETHAPVRLKFLADMRNQFPN